MSTRITASVAVVVAALFATSCSKSETPAPATAAVQSNAAPESKVVKACDLITVDEIAALAGKPLEAHPDEGVGRTGCVWEPAGGGFTRLEFKIEWGSAEAAMTGLGMLESHEPGITDPYDGVGDEAVVVGPAVMIKRDEDLITIVLSGVDDSEAAVRKMYELATARMQS